MGLTLYGIIKRTKNGQSAYLVSEWYTVQEARHRATSPHKVWGGTGDLGMDPHADSTDTKDGLRDVYPRNGSFVPVSNYGPDKDVKRSCVFWGNMVFFFIWCINAGPYR